MSRRRKDSLAKMLSLVPELERHLGRIAANPQDISVDHYKDEARAWLTEIERLVPHVGKKTGAQWQERIAQWRRALER